MQAIILAAGMGKRLGEFTQNNTKCMVKVNGIPLIDRMLNQLLAYNLSKIVIVIGYQGEKLKNHVQALKLPIPINFVENPIYDKTNNIYSLALAKDFLRTEDTILLESDLIFDDKILAKLIHSPHKNAALVAPYQTWMDGTMVSLDDNQKIVSFIPKAAFNFQQKSAYYKTVNIYKFSRQFCIQYYVPFLEAYTQAQGNNEYYEQVLRVLTLIDNLDLYGIPLQDENWYEIDDKQDLDIAETIFAPDSMRLQKYHQRYGGFWRFPKLKDFCYLVNPYFPPRTLVSELCNNFSTLLTQYPSGSLVNNLLVSKYFGIQQKYIQVGNGAAELIRPLMKQLSGNVGVILPTFEEYPNRYDANQLVVYQSEFPDFHYSAEELIEFYTPRKISSLLIVNPDNPSGNFIDAAGLAKLLTWSQSQGIRLIIDESFIDFADAENCSLLVDDCLEKYPNLVVMKSISKSYGVPGLRLGIMATSDKKLLQAVQQDLPIWNINSFAEFYLQIYGKYASEYRKSSQKFREERQRFFAQLQQITYLKVFPSQANYFLAQVTAKFSATELVDNLLKNSAILLKDCSSKSGFASKNYIRIAIRSQADNDYLVAELQKLQ